MSEYGNLQKALRDERIETKNKIKTSCDAILNNVHTQRPSEDIEIINENINNYAEAVRNEIEQEEKKLYFNNDVKDTLVIEEAKYLLKQRISESKKLITLKLAHIAEVDSDILSLETKIRDTEAALTKAREPIRPAIEVTAEHIEKARERFKLLKEELHNLIRAFFPDSERIVQLMGALVEAKTKGEMDIDIEGQDIKAIYSLKMCGIVAANPYDKSKIKLIV